MANYSCTIRWTTKDGYSSGFMQFVFYIGKSVKFETTIKSNVLWTVEFKKNYTKMKFEPSVLLKGIKI